MTPQEVYNKLYARYVFIAEGIFDSYEVTDELFSALEKQIPKKPVTHGYRESREVNTISYTCPICNKHVGIRENYCKHCGQALDWSEEE